MRKPLIIAIGAIALGAFAVNPIPATGGC